jgi:biopolymer transport protein ExbD
MAGGAHRRGAAIEGINVTPLVDVVLVLLVVFLVTAPLLVKPAVPLDLPEASTGEALATPLEITLTAGGALLVDGRPARTAELAGIVRDRLAREPGLRAVIAADATVSHGEVLGLLDTLRAAGMTRVAFGARPSERSPGASHEARP